MALESILGPLGELLELSWQPGGLLEASWNALGRLRLPQNIIRIGSWTAQGHLRDRFWMAWAPNTLPKRAQEGPKSRSKNDQG